MKFIYFTQESDFNSGVGKKIISQIKLLKNFGFDAKIISITHRDITPVERTDLIDHIQVNTFGIKNVVITTILRHYQIYKYFKQCTIRLGKNDILYIRSIPPNPLYILALYRRTLCKIIGEFQTKECEEKRLQKPVNLYCFLDALFGKYFIRCFDGIVSVTEEINQYQLKRGGFPPIPSITIGNGFDVLSVPVRVCPPFKGNCIDILCVASVSKWHGLDRILKGMVEYKGNTWIVFHITGDGTEIPLLMQRVKENNLQNQVLFYGFKTGEDLDLLFNRCHIAVGSLGIHRKNLMQTSELKAREYSARGIPFIAACTDADFPEDFPYIHLVPPDESPIDIKNVIDFAHTVWNDADHPKKMREYALEKLDWSIKIQKLVKFISDCDKCKIK